MYRQHQASVYRNCEGFEKRWQSHFWEINKILKIAEYWTEPLNYIKWNREWTEIYITEMCRYYIVSKSQIVRQNFLYRNFSFKITSFSLHVKHCG